MAIASVTVALLAACSATPIRLAPRFELGSSTRYLLTTDALTTFSGASGNRILRSTLEATTVLEVSGVGPQGVTLTVSVTPTAATRDGTQIETPAAQEVEVRVAADGSLIEILGDDTTAALGAFSASDLAGVLGPVLPDRRVHLGDRWDDAVSDGRTQGRVVSLRRTLGFDSVVLALRSSRTVERRRSLDGRPLSLDGIERSATMMDRALADGSVVSLETDARTTLTVRSGTLLGGRVLIEARTRLTREV